MKIKVSALEAQMRNVDFLENGFTGQTDCIVVWYSATNNGLSSNDLLIPRVRQPRSIV
jgi:hypothetical protein